MSHNIADIVANPENFGFSWGEDVLHKDGKALGLCPFVVHKDLGRMREVFGDDYFLSSANGTSRRVTDQRIGRDLRWDDINCKSDEIKAAIVANMLGQKARRGGVKTVTVTVEKPVFLGMDGKSYESELEAKQANLAHMVDQGVDANVARTLLGL